MIRRLAGLVLLAAAALTAGCGLQSQANTSSQPFPYLCCASSALDHTWRAGSSAQVPWTTNKTKGLVRPRQSYLGRVDHRSVRRGNRSDGDQ